MLFTRKLIFATKIIILLCGLLYCIATIIDLIHNSQQFSSITIKPLIMLAVKELAYGLSFIGTAVMIELLERLAFHIVPREIKKR